MALLIRLAGNARNKMQAYAKNWKMEEQQKSWNARMNQENNNNINNNGKWSRQQNNALAKTKTALILDSGGMVTPNEEAKKTKKKNVELAKGRNEWSKTTS